MNCLRLVIGVFALAGAVMAFAGCDKEQPLDPPEVHCGRDTCAQCGMIINETRFAAAIIVDNNGVRENLLFDDVGEFLEYDQAHPELKVLARYVHEYDSPGWAGGEAALYLTDPGIPTPMGTGVIAFSSAAAREATQQKLGGSRLDFTQARTAQAAKATPGR